MTTPTSERIVYLDTETGGLRVDDRPWEVALIVEQDSQIEQYLFHVSDFRPGDADQKALELGGFYDRHPLWAPDENLANLAIAGPDLDLPVRHHVAPEAAVVHAVEQLTRRLPVVGCNPGFDTFRILERAFARHGFATTWHYRPICATTYAAAIADRARAHRGEPPLPLPWTNEVVGAALGVPRDGSGTVHTGLADAHYARNLLRAARGVWEAA